MEYIQNRLVLRLQKPIAEFRLAALQSEYADLFTDGGFHQQDSIVGEFPRPELAGLTRLSLHFNRRSLGRLRQLINEINAG
jgi:hypothetical protein